MYSRKIDNPEQFRVNFRKKLEPIFEGNGKHASNLEKGIHNWSLKEATNRKVIKKWDNPYFVQIYLDRARTIWYNLKNVNLVNMVLTGEIKAHTIAFMTHQEMNPDRWDELIRAKMIRDKNKYEQHLEASTDTFTCRKCRSKKCVYTQLQTRSADEPMTTFVQCTECSNRWKC